MGLDTEALSGVYRVSPMGRLELALDEAHRRGWTVVSMKDDWKSIFSFDK